MSYIGVDVLDSIIDLNDYQRPIKKQVQTIYTLSSSKIYKEIHIYLKSGVINTDEGWFLEMMNEKSFLKIDKDREFSREVLPNENEIARVFLRMSNLQEVFQRKYDKIQDVAANVGWKENIHFFLIFLIKIIFFEIKNFKEL